jgi:hypothetical protein
LSPSGELQLDRLRLDAVIERCADGCDKSASCSGRLAPMIGLVITGFAKTHCTAMVAIDTQRRRQSFAAPRDPNLRSFQYRSGRPAASPA